MADTTQNNTEKEVREVHHRDDGNGAGWAIALVLIVLVALFFIFGLPGGSEDQVDTIPDEVNVNLDAGDSPSLDAGTEAGSGN